MHFPASLPFQLLLSLSIILALLAGQTDARPRSGSVSRDLGPNLYERFYGPEGLYAQQIYSSSTSNSSHLDSRSIPLSGYRLPTLNNPNPPVYIHPLRRSESECTPSVPVQNTSPNPTQSSGPVPASGLKSGTVSVRMGDSKTVGTLTAIILVVGCGLAL